MTPKDWVLTVHASWALTTSDNVANVTPKTPANRLIVSIWNPADLVAAILSRGLDSLEKTYGEILRDCATELRGGKHSDARRLWLMVGQDVYSTIQKHGLISPELAQKIQGFAGYMSRPNVSTPETMQLNPQEALLALCFFLKRAENWFGPYYYRVAEKLCEMYPNMFDWTITVKTA